MGAAHGPRGKVPIQRLPDPQRRAPGWEVAEAVLDLRSVWFAGNKQLQCLRRCAVFVVGFPAPDRQQHGLAHQRPLVARPVGHRLPGGGRHLGRQFRQGQGRAQWPGTAWGPPPVLALTTCQSRAK